jgi:hypothetical protein
MKKARNKFSDDLIDAIIYHGASNYAHFSAVICVSLCNDPFAGSKKHTEITVFLTHLCHQTNDSTAF